MFSKSTYDISRKVISMGLACLFLCNTAAVADVTPSDNLLSPHLLFADANKSAEAQALAICKLIENQAKSSESIKDLCVDDLLLWANSTDPLVGECEFEILPLEIRIHIPSSNLCVRYYDSDPEKAKTFIPYMDTTRTETTVVNTRINRQIFYKMVAVPALLKSSPVNQEKLVRIITSLASLAHGTNNATELLTYMYLLGMGTEVVRDIIGQNDELSQDYGEAEELRKEMSEEIAGGLTDLYNNALSATEKGELEENKILAWQHKTEELYRLFEKVKERLAVLIRVAEPYLPDRETVSKLEKYIKKLEKYIQQADEIFKDRLLLMRGEISDTSVSLNAIFNTLLDDLFITSRGAFRKYLDIKIPEHPISIVGNRNSIVSLICNLADNCFRYTRGYKKDGAKITIEAKTEGDQAVIIVSDNGPGMSQEEVERIWEPFYTTEGTGIGLTEARLIAKDHGGTITVDSEPGKGTTFTVRLPIEGRTVSAELEETTIPSKNTITYNAFLQENIPLIETMLQDSPEPILLPVPIEAIEYIGEENFRSFLNTIQRFKNCYPELYYASGTHALTEEEKARLHEKYGVERKPLPQDFERKRENILTLFPVLKGEELTRTTLLRKLSSLDLKPQDTVISPIGRQHDPLGLIRATVFGLNLIHIARHKGRINDEFIGRFIEPSVRYYQTLCESQGVEGFNLTNQHLIDLATGDDNELVRALKVLMELLPILPTQTADEVRQTYKAAIKTLISL